MNNQLSNESSNFKLDMQFFINSMKGLSDLYIHMYIGFQFTLYVDVENMMVFFFYCILGELVFFF